MRRLTPHSDSRLQAWFPQADGEVLLAERKTTTTLELLRLLRRLLLTIPSVSDHCLRKRAALSPRPCLHSLALSPSSRAFNAHSSVVARGLVQ